MDHARRACLRAALDDPGPSRASSQSAARPLGLPFTTPPGPATWLIIQQYGNTTGAYNFGRYWYAAGQGFHFGVDFSTQCQTPLVALADGVVAQVDNLSNGSAPHNLSILHADLGLVSFYGHLYSTPTVKRGQIVKRGEVVALSGDPDGTCVSRPHLHLEIRSTDYGTTYDPAMLIDADWNMLSTLGSMGASFSKDLYYPNRWQTIDEQPNVRFGGNILNQYRAAWPPRANNLPPAATLPAFDAPPVSASPRLTRLSTPGCCSLAWWSPDSQSVRFWNGADGQRATLNAITLKGEALPVTVPEPGLQSPDGAYALKTSLDNATSNQVAVMRLSDQKVWPLATGGAWPRFSPGSARILWQHSPADSVPGGTIPLTDIWVSNPDGSGRIAIGTQPGGSVYWLDEDRLLLVVRQGHTLVTKLSIYTISTKQSAPLITLTSLRGLTVAHGGGSLLYYLTWQPNPADSALYVLKTQPGAAPTKLPFVGGWRWRDSHSVVYIPYTPGKPGGFRAVRPYKWTIAAAH